MISKDSASLLTQKYNKLQQILRDMESCLIAFSGGVDSTFLLAVATEILGDKVLAVTATSETYPERELFEARKLAAQIGARHIEIVSEELELSEFKENPRNRCYYCKRELFSKLRAVADQNRIKFVLDGTNFDDRADYRPGRQAAAEIGVCSPLDSAGLTKENIRELSKQIGLPTWDKPAFACLSSRFPYGVAITPERVRQVGIAEENLFLLGFKTVRLRYHGDVARLELGEKEFVLATGKLRLETIAIVKSAGFHFVAIDLVGYRTGSMNTPE